MALAKATKTPLGLTLKGGIEAVPEVTEPRVSRIEGTAALGDAALPELVPSPDGLDGGAAVGIDALQRLEGLVVQEPARVSHGAHLPAHPQTSQLLRHTIHVHQHAHAACTVEERGSSRRCRRR